jgi:hypothetical protein
VGTNTVTSLGQAVNRLAIIVGRLADQGLSGAEPVAGPQLPDLPDPDDSTDNATDAR